MGGYIMEDNKNLKKIPILDDQMESIVGGVKNVDENGKFITDYNKMMDWYNSTKSKTYHNICPICKKHMYECTWYNTDGNVIWYMFWYNRLYCTTENKWHDNELY